MMGIAIGREKRGWIKIAFFVLEFLAKGAVRGNKII